MVDPSCSGRGRRFLLRLVDLIHDGVDAAMAFDGVPIGIGDGLPKNRCFRLGRCRVSGCPGLENLLGAVEMVLVPSDRKHFDSPACLPELVPKLPVGLAPAMEQVIREMAKKIAARARRLLADHSLKSESGDRSRIGHALSRGGNRNQTRRTGAVAVWIGGGGGGVDNGECAG